MSPIHSPVEKPCHVHIPQCVFSHAVGNLNDPRRPAGSPPSIVSDFQFVTARERKIFALHADAPPSFVRPSSQRNTTKRIAPSIPAASTRRSVAIELPPFRRYRPRRDSFQLDRLRNSNLDHHQAFAPFRPPVRQQDPKQPIITTQAGATSSAALPHGYLMAQGDRFQHQRGAGSGFASGDRDRSACRHRHEGRLSPGVRNHQ